MASKTETVPKKEKAPEKKMVTSKMLADRLGTKAATLRRYLRTLPQFQDGGYTRYKWEEDDKFLKTAEEGFKKYQEKEKERNKKRLEEVKAKGKDAKAAGGGKTPKTKKKDEDEDEEEETEID